MAAVAAPAVISPAERALAALDDAGVMWSLLRGEPPVGEPLRADGDIDLLVAAADLPCAHDALRRLGFARVPAWGRGGHRFYLGYDASSDVWLRLDLDTQLAFGAHEHLLADCAATCLARGVRVDGLWLLDRNDAFWALLLHCLLDKHAFKSQYRERLQGLAPLADADSPLAVAARPFMPAGWDAERSIVAIQAGDWDGLLAMGARLERRWARGGQGARRAALVNGALQRMTKLLNLTRRRGLAVALLGPDGAGKSTVADGVRQSFYLPSRLVYMGMYQNERAGRSVSLPGARFALRLLAQWRRYLPAVYHQARGRLVMFDRYTYDHLAAMSPSASRKSRLRRWLLAHACPPPDLALVLDAPGEVLFARKGEHNPEQLEAQRQRLSALAARRVEMEVVDVTRDPDSVRRDIIERIWRRYAARWN